MRKRNYNLKLTGLAAAMASLGAAFSLPAFALEVVSEGDLTVTVDTTLSAGAAFRASDINYENVGRYNAAAAQGVDPATLGGSTTAASDTFVRHKHLTGVQDNSDLRWKKGKAFSEVVKGSVDVQAEYKDYGAFVRGKFFYDDAIVKGGGGTALPAFYPTTDSGAPAEPEQSKGRGAEFLDAFVWGNWSFQDRPLNVRLGQQVINWGEGVLFPNSINTVNPVDVNALLTPGAELKEALIPVKMLYASLGITDNISAEAFYQFQWRETRVPDCGTFFNTIDIVGDNCNGGFFAYGFDSGSTSSSLGSINGVLGNDGLRTAFGVSELSPRSVGTNDFRLMQGVAIEPEDGGEFGMALRYYVDAIQTEFAGYFINYHSRLPILSGYAPSATAMDLPATNSVTTALAVSERLKTGYFALEYPEDIQLFGLSFNTNFNLGLPGGESAVSGEISYRKDQPFQVEDSVLLTGLIGAPTQICDNGVDTNSDGAANCFDEYAPGEFITGGIREDFYQAEVSFIHFFDNVLAADRWTVLLDMAYDYANIPDKDKLLMNSAYNADLRPAWTALYTPGTATTSDAFLSDSLSAGGFGEANYFPTKSSYGYKLRLSGEYSNVFAGVNLVPTISFSHDLKGVTPGPVANFLEDRKALGLSLEANYLNTYKVEAGYTDFYGAEPYNQLNDRDFYSISGSVSF